ncbi:hypothetical protein Q7P37_009994 [Cladosporium fusiforme]
MSTLVEPHEALLLAEKQAGHHAKAVRRLDFPATDLNDLREMARGLQPKDVFKEYQEIRFVYEYLRMGEGLSAVRELVKSWIDKAENLADVESIVSRKKAWKVLNGFAVFKMKEQSGLAWSRLNDHGRTDADLDDQNHPQTIVFIALTHLNYDNGFFMPLEPGTYVCIDSAADIVYPPSGGGIGVMMYLNI